MTVARREQLAKVAEELEEVIPGAFEGDSHALLMAVYKDTRNDMAMRLDAAKAAIGYEKPRLASIEANVKATVTQEDALAAIEQARQQPGLNEHPH
jgi:hypothetical protein